MALPDFINRLRRRSASQPIPRQSRDTGASVALSDPATLLTSHRKKLTALRLESGYSEAHFRTYVYGPLMQCARYVHELPASRAENHREPGGLFRFSLETAFLAFRRADGKLFPQLSETKASSRDVDLAWRYSAFVSGLCMSLGRVASGVTLSSEDGKLLWNPYAQSLCDWAEQHNLAEFKIDWRSRQDARNPTQASVWIAANLLEKDVLDNLYLGTSTILDATLDVIAGRADSPLSELVRESMNSVIDQDLAASRQSDSQPTTGISIEHRVLDAIRGLIRDKWTSNTAGSRVWVADKGVFINWKPAVNDIVVRLRADGVTGIPADADTVAELLQEKSIISVNDHATTLSHYFRIVVHAPHVPKAPMDCVRIVNPMLLGLQLDAVSPVTVDVVGQPNDKDAIVDDEQTQLDLIEASDRDNEDTGPKEMRTDQLDTKRAEQTKEELPSSGPPITKPEEAPSSPSPLRRYGDVGKILEALASEEAHPFLRVKDGIALAYPGAVETHCERPKEFLTSCQTQSLLVPENPGSNRVVRKRRKTEEGLPDQYIVLVPRLAKSLGITGATT